MTLTLEENFALSINYAMTGDSNKMEEAIRETKAAAFHRGNCISNRLLKTIRTIGYKRGAESMLDQLAKNAEEGDAHYVEVFSSSAISLAERYLALQYGLFRDHEDGEAVKFFPETEKKLSKKKREVYLEQSVRYANRVATRLQVIQSRSYVTGLPVSLRKAEEDAMKRDTKGMRANLARAEWIAGKLNVDVSTRISNIKDLYAQSHQSKA